jgi:hypothetical protein
LWGACQRGTQLPHASRLQDGTEGCSPEPARARRASLHSPARGESIRDLRGEGARHLVNLEKPWRRIRKAAKLDDVRLHDLRHSFASVAALGGQSLVVIGKMLGLSQPATTARYAHLADDPVGQRAMPLAGTLPRQWAPGPAARLLTYRDLGEQLPSLSGEPSPNVRFAHENGRAWLGAKRPLCADCVDLVGGLASQTPTVV